MPIASSPSLSSPVATASVERAGASVARAALPLQQATNDQAPPPSTASRTVQRADGLNAINKSPALICHRDVDSYDGQSLSHLVQESLEIELGRRLTAPEEKALQRWSDSSSKPNLILYAELVRSFVIRQDTKILQLVKDVMKCVESAEVGPTAALSWSTKSEEMKFKSSVEKFEAALISSMNKKSVTAEQVLERFDREFVADRLTTLRSAGASWSPQHITAAGEAARANANVNLGTALIEMSKKISMVHFEDETFAGPAAANDPVVPTDGGHGSARDPVYNITVSPTISPNISPFFSPSTAPSYNQTYASTNSAPDDLRRGRSVQSGGDSGAGDVGPVDADAASAPNASHFLSKLALKANQTDAGPEDNSLHAQAQAEAVVRAVPTTASEMTVDAVVAPTAVPPVASSATHHVVLQGQVESFNEAATAHSADAAGEDEAGSAPVEDADPSPVPDLARDQSPASARTGQPGSAAEVEAHRLPRNAQLQPPRSVPPSDVEGRSKWSLGNTHPGQGASATRAFSAPSAASNPVRRAAPGFSDGTGERHHWAVSTGPGLKPGLLPTDETLQQRRLAPHSRSTFTPTTAPVGMVITPASATSGFPGMWALLQAASASPRALTPVGFSTLQRITGTEASGEKPSPESGT